MSQVKCKVVMLPTEKASPLVLNSDGFLEYDWVLATYGGVTQQFLYILSDEEITEKFEGFCIDDKGFIRHGMSDLYTLSLSKKIIASTDESLGLPRPSDSFIKKYCEKGGIDEVMVEYELITENICAHCNGILYQEWSRYNGRYFHKETSSSGCIDKREIAIPIQNNKLKVTPDNTIPIKPLKISYTSEEVEKLMCLAWDKAIDVNNNIDNYLYSDGKAVNDFTVKGWIKENL